MKRRRITAPVTRRGAAGAEQRAPQAGVELRPEDGYLQLVLNKESFKNSWIQSVIQIQEA